MAYDKTGVINMALGRIGALRIVDAGEDSAQAIAANNVWDYIRDEVLEAGNWSFARTRKALVQNPSSPAFGYDYAYTLPSDFLKLAENKEDDPCVYPSGSYHTSYVFGQFEIEGTRYSYSIETLSDGTMVLATDYDNSSADLYIIYIRRVVDVNKFSASFINALAFRLAAELTMPLSKGKGIYDTMMLRYEKALDWAEAHDRKGEYLENETGNSDWEDAGR